MGKKNKKIGYLVKSAFFDLETILKLYLSYKDKIEGLCFVVNSRKLAEEISFGGAIEPIVITEERKRKKGE